jgi:hypothetical protein
MADQSKIVSLAQLAKRSHEVTVLIERWRAEPCDRNEINHQKSSIEYGNQ